MRTVIAILFLYSFLFLSILETKAQSDTTKTISPKVELSGFIEPYYVYDFNQPKTDYRQIFFYNHNRHNKFNINLGFIEISAQHQKYRANIGWQTGTYATDNYANEQGLLKNIFEANAGISLNKKNNLWLDAGIFASHIGFESANSIDNWTLTRSILAENSPYYLSGAKLTYTPSKKVEFILLVSNGWQHIQKIKGNSLQSFGTQIKVLLNNKITLNWSTFVGTDDPDTTRRMRYFNNFYGQFQCTEKFGLIVGLDIGTQQRVKNSSIYSLWFSPVIIGQFSINKNWKTAIRAEYYQDETGIIIATGTINGFKTTGLSLNLDYTPTTNVACRIEGRWLNSKDKIFETKTTPTNDNLIIGTSIAIKFSVAKKK
ncbi:MAG: porin [Saprospiraceae bacterium]|nr:porin [Saprospiraceae bacterium]